jgi:hypothetical protein
MKYRALLTAIIIAASISIVVGTLIAQADLNQAYARAVKPICQQKETRLNNPDCNPGNILGLYLKGEFIP